MIAVPFVIYMAWFSYDKGNEWGAVVLGAFAALIATLAIYNAFFDG